MDKFFYKVVQHRKKIIALFCLAFLICAGCKQLVSVNYDMNSYLPEDAESTVALNTMEKEFDGGIPKARVMVKNVTVPEALEYKEKIEKVKGVTDVTWLDDSVDIEEPLETMDQDTVETYYKDNNALFSVTIEEDHYLDGVANIRKIIGDDNCMTGAAVSTALATNSTVHQVTVIAIAAVAFAIFVLILTTTSWVEPFVVMIGLGMAVVLNAGTNLIFGEISFVTNAAGSVLQMAVSLDYSVFLIHRFEECVPLHDRKEDAMIEALSKSFSSILSSGLTTVIGFLALVLMRFQIGPDMGLALAKGIAISLIVVFVFMPGMILVAFSWMEKTTHRPFLPSFKKFGNVVARITIPIALVFILIAFPAYRASGKNEFYYGSSHIFAVGTTYGDDTKEIKDIFGKSDTYVVLVPKGDTATEYKLVQECKKLGDVKSVIAFVEQAGPEIPYEYLDEETLAKLESNNYSRIVLSVSADYEGEETVSLIKNIKTICKKYYPDEYYLAGEGVSTYDLMNTVQADMVKVNLLAIGAVFVVLLLTMRNLAVPVVLVLTIENAIWINLGIYYFADKPLFYIAYLIISSIQLGATVDYAILFTERYKENQSLLSQEEIIPQTIADVMPSIMTSGFVLIVVGFLMGIISTHQLLSQLGYLLGKGTICSLLSVVFVLPGLLTLLERGRKGGNHEQK